MCNMNKRTGYGDLFGSFLCQLTTVQFNFNPVHRTCVEKNPLSLPGHNMNTLDPVLYGALAIP